MINLRVNSHEKYYSYFVNFSLLILFLSYFGIVLVNKEYSNILSILIRLYISIILIIQYNPYSSNKKNNKLCNSRIAYDAGWWLLFSILTSNTFKELVIQFYQGFNVLE